MSLRKSQIVIYLLGTFAVVFVVAVVVAWGIGRYHLQRMEARVLDHSLEDQAIGAVIDDGARLSRLPAIAQAAAVESLIDPARDAGSYLNAQLPWYPKGGPSDGTLMLPLGVREAVDTWGSTWPTYMEKAPLAEVNFSWMAALHRYAYWQLEEPQGEDVVAATDPLLSTDQDPTYESLPELGLLTVWVKLRLASILQGAPADTALSELYQLVFLALTSQRMSVIQAGLMWQELAHEAVVFAKEAGKPFSLPEVFMTPEQIRMARYAIPAQMAYLDLAIPPDLALRMFPLGSHRLGVCAALHQRLPALRWQKALLGETYPEAFRALDPLVHRLAQGCRPSRAFLLWARGEAAPLPLLTTGGALRPMFSKWPVMKKIFGLTLYDLVRSHELEPYRPLLHGEEKQSKVDI